MATICHIHSSLQITYVPEEKLVRFSAKLFNCTPAQVGGRSCMLRYDLHASGMCCAVHGGMPAAKQLACLHSWQHAALRQTLYP